MAIKFKILLTRDNLPVPNRPFGTFKSLIWYGQILSQEKKSDKPNFAKKSNLKNRRYEIGFNETPQAGGLDEEK